MTQCNIRSLFLMTTSIFCSSLSIIILLGIRTSLAQGVSAAIMIDSSRPHTPLKLSLVSNTRKDINSIRITVKAPSKFASFFRDSSKINVIPFSDYTLGAFFVADSSVTPTGNNIPIAWFLTDSGTWQQSFTVDFLNADGQLIATQFISITILPFYQQLFFWPGTCDQQFLALNSGVDENGSPIAPGSIDPAWTISSMTGTPPNCDNITISPDVFVVSKNPWPHPTTMSNDPLTIAQWINPGNIYDGGSYGLYGLGCTGDYTYHYTFCATDTDKNATLDFWCASDNWMTILSLNGGSNLLSTAQLAALNTNSFYLPTHIMLTHLTVLPGMNHFDITIYNDASKPSYTGLLIYNGSIQTTVGNLGLKSNLCCDPHGCIYGYKYWDKNCNGRRDPGDQGLSGWTITVTGGGVTKTAITDSNGYYALCALPIGTYTVTETGQTGWVPSSSSGPYTVSIVAGSRIECDFLNCKRPDCGHLFTQTDQSGSCCTSNFSVSNGYGASLSTLTYSVSGGVIDSISTSPCPFTTSQLPNSSGTTSGTLTFNTTCTGSNVENFEVKATATNATGIVCVSWFAVFTEDGGPPFTCDTTMCIQCPRLQKNCDSSLNVLPLPWLDDTITSWRRFNITNAKMPASLISSIDLVFSPSLSSSNLNCTNLKVDGSTRTWGHAYTPMRMDCLGNSGAAQGTAAFYSAVFNLGIVKSYTGTVTIKVGYCDGDSCISTYDWPLNSPLNVSNTINWNIGPANLHVFGLDFTPIDSTTSVSINIADTTSKIIAITAPAPDSTIANGGNLFGLNVKSTGNAALYLPEKPREPNQPTLPRGNVTVVYTSAINSASDSTSIIVDYFDRNGKVIGRATKEVHVSKIVNIVNPPGIMQASNDIAITSVIPNPATSSVTFTYSLGESEPVRLELFNMLGQSVAVVADGFQTLGEHQITYNIVSLSEGTYYLRLSNQLERVSAVVKIIH